MNSRKALIKTVVAIFSIIFLVFVFILFFWLFKISGEKSTGQIESQYSSLTTDLALKDFLRSPVYDTQGNPPKDLTGDVGEEVTNANLVSWTCTNEKNQNYISLMHSAYSFFDNLYGNDWSISIFYSDKDINTKKFAKGSIIKPFKEIAQAFSDSRREKGFATQIIPCGDGSFAKIVIKASDYPKIKDLK